MSYWPDTDQIGSLYTESVAIGSGRFIPPQSVTIGDRALRARFSIHQSDWIFSRIRSGGVTWTFHCINWYFWRHLRFTLFWQRHNTRPTNFAMKRFHLDNYIFSSSTLKKFQLLTNGPFLSHCVQYATSIQKLAVTQIFCFGLVFSLHRKFVNLLCSTAAARVQRAGKSTPDLAASRFSLSCCTRHFNCDAPIVLSTIWRKRVQLLLKLTWSGVRFAPVYDVITLACSPR